MKINLAGYQIGELIYDGTRTLVYRGTREEDHRSVILKKLRPEYPTFSELLQFRHQYVLTKNLQVPGIVKPITLEKYGNGYVLVMEDVGGISLSDYYSRPLNLEEFFNVGLALTKILEQLYQNRVIHKDIKPANILINPETKEIFLIDFSISSLLPRESQEIQNPNVLEGTLAYISPEQTGRMNRGIDYRSDFYGLGVTFYELLAGEVPFKSEEPMELVHCHIARMPVAPHLVKAEIPEVLSKLVMKLMAKTAENRYQSALGLKFDLEKARSMWLETGKIAAFELGERDISDRFIIPEKLYGRESEVQALLSAFDRVAAGQAEMMLVAGYSGIGKTAVVNEVHKPIVRQRGYFIKGKFDQFQRNIPFSALVIALRDLMGQLLAETDAQLQEWKGKILDAVGENSGVIIEVIPELERIIGKKPPVAEFSGTAAQNRFNRLFEKFICVFTTKEHPLVLFLDDLQWADSASLNLLKLLTTQTETGYLLLLGAYRDNEVNPVHPLMLTLDDLNKAGATVNTITLPPLNSQQLNLLVAETLSCSPELALPLTELVYQKTEGNPFFATQFLKGLHFEGAIAFKFDLGYWQCEMTRVRSLALSDDVVEFMALQLQKLPPATVSVLKLAACIGDRFELETLAVVRSMSPTEVASSLWRALQFGLVLPLAETYKFFQDSETDSQEGVEEVSVGYKFLHDRVQQAAYSLIPEADKEKTHLQIGKLLLNNTSESNREAQIFAIVSQLNIGAALIEDQQEREELARLNLIAARKAKASTAYQSACDNLKVAIELLGEDCWEKQYELTRYLYEEAALVAYLMGDFDGSDFYGQFVLERGKTILEKIEIYHIKIQSLVALQKFNEAIECGLGVVDSLGIVIETEPPSLEKIEKLKDLPDMTDPYQLAALKMLDSIGAALFSTNKTLFKQGVYTVLNLSVKYGNSMRVTKSYLDYGMILCGMEGDVETGYRLAKMGLELFMERFSDKAKEQISVVWHLFNGSVRHWQEPLKNSLASCLEIFQIGQENGEIMYSGYQALTHLQHLLLLGSSLDILAAKCQSYIEILQKNNLVFHIDFAQLSHQTALNLLGRSEHSIELIGEAFDETEKLPMFQQYSIGIFLFIIYALKGKLAYLFGEIEACINWTQEARKWQDNATGFFLVPVNQFYSCLGLLDAYHNSSSDRQQEIISQVESDQKQMHYWATHAPANFQHKYDLVEAEKAKVLEQYWQAAELYDRAITGAAENEFLSEEASSNELAAKFYLHWGKEKIARTYMQDAYYCYARWGAKAKVDDLEKRYPQLLAPILNRNTTGNSPGNTIAKMTVGTLTTTNTETSLLLDLSSAMKASQILSGEMELKQLLVKLMQLVMENAGATKSALLIPQDKKLAIEGIAAYNAENILEVSSVGESLPIESTVELPIGIIQTVWRAGEAVVLNDVSSSTEEAASDYLKSNQPQSLWCTPLVNGGKLVAILYLENNLIAGAFTSDRLSILNILTSQAAISIENARLYEQSQDYSRQLEDSLLELQDAQLQLVQSEKMATIGQLVSGVAHEINNPIGFISGNLNCASEYVQNLMELLELYKEGLEWNSETTQEKIEEIDLDYLLEDFPELISSMKVGTERIAEISKSMRTFSRSDTATKVPFNIHDGIDSTLLILKHRLKAGVKGPEIEVVKNYGLLSEISCYPGQLNQVFMNLLANAIDALEESNEGKTYEEIQAHPNRITITTEIEEEKQLAIVRIADNGPGMPEEVKEKIFEHLFTTKGVGKGTGLGLSISRQIVEEKHGGKITLTSEVGRGTEFWIALPLS